MELAIAVLSQSIKCKMMTGQILKWNDTNTDLCLPTSLLRWSLCVLFVQPINQFESTNPHMEEIH